MDYDRSVVENWTRIVGTLLEESPHTEPDLSVVARLSRDVAIDSDQALSLRIARSEHMDGICLGYRIRGGNLQVQCNLTRAVVAAWNVGHLVKIDDIERDGNLGFQIKADAEGVTVSQSKQRSEPLLTPPRLAIFNQEPFPQLASRFLAGIDALPHEPEKLQITIAVPPWRYPTVVKLLGDRAKTWGYSFQGWYQKGLDPFKRPDSIPEEAPLRYPVLGARDKREDQRRLQIDVVHTREQSFLEFQTTEDWDWITEMLDDLKVKYEFWDGPFAERWGE